MTCNTHPIKEIKKIAFLGNADNVNLRVCSWFRKCGYDADIFITENKGSAIRGGVQLYFPQYNSPDNTPRWIISGDFDGHRVFPFIFFQNKQKEKIHNEYDLVFVSGLRGLIAANAIKLPKVLIPVGFEVNYFCVPRIKFNNSIKEVLNWILYSFFAKKALKKIDVICDCFKPDYLVFEYHHVLDSVVRNTSSIGEDCEWMRSKKNHSLLEKLEAENKSAHRIFLWFSRLMFKDAGSASYKAPERFMSALESQVNKLESGDLVVYMGKHGADAEDFIEFCKKFKCSQYIKWVDHLDHPDLLAYLSLSKAVLFTAFGDYNAHLTGIGRDGYAIGIPMVNNALDDNMIRQFGAPGPRLFAKTVDQTVEVMNKLMSMSNKEYEKIKKDTLEYGNKYLDYKVYIPKLIKNIEDRLKVRFCKTRDESLD